MVFFRWIVLEVFPFSEKEVFFMMFSPFVSDKKAVIKYLTAFIVMLSASLFFL